MINEHNIVSKLIRRLNIPAPLKGQFQFNNKACLCIGRRIIPLEVFASATRTRPSGPEIVLTILPMSHFWGGILSSWTKTKAPTATLQLAAVHLFLTWSSLMYSWDHFFQDRYFTAVIWAQYSKLVMLIDETFLSGRDRSALPVIKWPGVSASRSLGSDDIGEIGLEFNIDSISTRAVTSSS